VICEFWRHIIPGARGPCVQMTSPQKFTWGSNVVFWPSYFL